MGVRRRIEEGERGASPLKQKLKLKLEGRECVGIGVAREVASLGAKSKNKWKPRPAFIFMCW